MNVSPSGPVREGTVPGGDSGRPSVRFKWRPTRDNEMPAARAARMASYRAGPFAMMLVHVTTPVRMQAMIPRFLSTPMLMLVVVVVWLRCVVVCVCVCVGYE